MTRPKIIDTPEQIADRKVLAILVRTMRAMLGWSQRDLAEMLGVTHTAIAKVEIAALRLLPDRRERLIAVFEEAGVQFKFAPDGISISLGGEVIAKLMADDALGLRVESLPMIEVPATSPNAQGSD